MAVLTVEQVVGWETIARQIEALQTTKSIKIRFFALGNGTDILIDGVEYNAFGQDMKIFLEEACEVPEHSAELLSKSWEVVGTAGFAEDLCLKSNGKFDWDEYSIINDLLCTHSEELLTAAKACGISWEGIEDKYQGQYDTFRVFVRGRWDELNLEEVPEHVRRYIDYTSIEEDWHHDYHFEDGYVFSS
ncbi:putative antirestriction protein [Pectobacterium phage PP101]|uniref:Putative antirestriction protein n=1 Tax=Pectobacterium phage PP101 TaxID=1916414 RepID=A0A1J0MF10_9CAUD|nr:anti-restriction protein [Pectobacterium phage PP101]APD19686.1 putative antirestriction protein [Pectobacterium phage PP101]